MLLHLIFCCLSSTSLSFCPFLRPKLQDAQLLSQHRKPLWWARSVHRLPASSPLQRQRCQHFISAPLCHQKRLLLQHQSLSLPQQVHGQERDGELLARPAVCSSNLSFFRLSDCLHVFASVFFSVCLGFLILFFGLCYQAPFFPPSFNLFLLICLCVLSTGGGPRSPGIIPAGPDQ